MYYTIRFGIYNNCWAQSGKLYGRMVKILWRITANLWMATARIDSRNNKSMKMYRTVIRVVREDCQCAYIAAWRRRDAIDGFSTTPKRNALGMR